jgi:hypothetical protein
MAAKLERIQDEGLRQSLQEAKTALRGGDYKAVVERSAEAYAELLRRKPEMLQGPGQIRNVLFFPRLGARLVVNHDGQPEIVYDRDKFIFSEAITYYEFAVDSLVKNGV